GSKNVGRGESPEYTVTVQTRPAVADMELTYNYPAYTGLQPHTDHSREGVIEALVGTKVHIVLHATEAVKSAEMTVSHDGHGKETRLALRPVDNAAAPEGTREVSYATDFTILKSSEYRVKLIKADGQENQDNQPRPIHARPDNPPSIGIILPDPKTP